MTAAPGTVEQRAAAAFAAVLRTHGEAVQRIVDSWRATAARVCEALATSRRERRRRVPPALLGCRIAARRCSRAPRAAGRRSPVLGSRVRVRDGASDDDGPGNDAGAASGQRARRRVEQLSGGRRGAC